MASIAFVTPHFDASATESDSFQRGLLRVLQLLDWAEVTVYTSQAEDDGAANGGWAVRRFPVQLPGEGSPIGPQEQQWLDTAPRWPQLIEALQDSPHSLYLLSPCRSPLIHQVGRLDPQNSILLADLQMAPEVPRRAWQEWLQSLGGILFTSQGERRLAEELYGSLPRARVLGIPIPSASSLTPSECGRVARICSPGGTTQAGDRSIPAQDPFQLSLREAWACSTPALVGSGAAVARDLCLQAEGGIAVQGAEGFRKAADYLHQHPETARALGRQGRQFVRSHDHPETLSRLYRSCLGAFTKRQAVQGARAALFSPSFLPHDAVSNYLAETCRFLEGWKADFSLHIQDHLERDDFASHLRPVSAIDPEVQLEIYHYPGWYPLMQRLERRQARGVTVFDFHGVTPLELWPDRSLEPSHQGIRLARQADFVFVHSRFLERELIEQHQVDPARLIRFPYSVGLSAFSPAPPDRGILEVYGLQGKTVLLYVGRMAPNKRIDLLVDGLARLPEECVLLMVGNIGFSLYAHEVEEARQLASGLGLEDRVIFTGSVSDAELQRIYSAADLMVSASLHEGFGVPFIEAMACAIPIVATDAASIPEVIGQAGRTFRPADPVHFAEQVSALLENDQEYRGCGESGLRQAQLYSRGALQDNFLSALAKVLSRC
ncbi:MAG: glycosyltransferase [Acidobacteriota bacterium]